MHTEYDEGVKDYWRISHGNYKVKMVDDKGLEDEVKQLNTMPLHFGALVLTFSKTILDIFINGFYTKDLYYTDTDSLKMKKKFGRVR